MICPRPPAAAGFPGLDAMLAAAIKTLPALGSILDQYGHLALGAYVERVSATAPEAPPPSPAIVDAVFDQTRAVFAPPLARLTAATVETHPAVLTANHHGVDFFAQSVQGNLICALPLAGEAPRAVLPVLAFANVPLNNLTYPRGMLVYDPAAIGRDGLPARCPLFPARDRRQPVHTAPALTAAQVKAAGGRFDAMGLSPALTTTARWLLERLYLSPALMAQPDYRHQAAHLNRLIWRLLFAQGVAAPELVCLAAEQLVVRLLMADLVRPESLAHRCLFDPRLRAALLHFLAGTPGCWPRPAAGGSHGGTVFFWGLDPHGRRIAMALDAHGRQLTGRSDSGTDFSLPFTPAAVSEALAQRRLLPSLYTCFLQIAFAHGLTGLGGYYQASYLPQMRAGTVEALKAAGDADTASRVAAVPARRYLSGMLGIMTRSAGGLFPAGPVEIIAAGGIDDNDLARLAALRVDQAHRAGLFDTIADAVAPADRPPHWAAALARACAASLTDVVVVKEL